MIMVQIQRVSPGEGREIINNILDRDGCIIIENVLSAAELAALKAELDPHFLKTALCHGDFYGHQTKRLSGLVEKSASCRSMCVQPKILEVMDAFLLKGSREYQLNLTQAIRIGPGEPEQIIHPDDPMFPFEHPGIEAMINCMWAVDDFTAENGATQAVPGSHRWPKDRRPEAHEILQAEMPAGSVLIYFGSLLHGGGANRTQKPRTGVVLSYNLGWLKQAENHFLAVPRAAAARYPERLQRLLGYFVHMPNLGCVEGQDPIRLLRGEHIQDVGFEEFLPEEVRPLLEEHRRQALKAA
jgi:ectoine hydroxylase-related dioxygenase (phytanoyl-CoA dioxygenase family)